MEEDDPVVQEIPVYLSQKLAKHLYIYQYPVKPGGKDWNDTKVVNSLIKPKNNLVKVEFGLDTYSDKYCTSKGEQIALNTDGQQEFGRRDREREKTQYFQSDMMDKLTYQSTAPCTDCGHYAVAVLQDKEMHCTPIKGIVQLRPSYSYFDKQDKRKKDSDKADNSEEEDEEAEAQQVTVKFARQETEVAKKAREKSFETVSKRSAEEPWCDSTWWHSTTDHADLERLKLFSQVSSEGAALALRGPQYVRALVPTHQEEDTAGEDRRQLAKLPLLDQCRKILADAKLLSFTEIRSLTRCPDSDGPASEGALLSALGAAACCVRGLWAPRSTDLYTEPSAAAGAPPKLMCAARDYMLYLFTQSSYVDRQKLAAAVRLPPIEVLQILESVAKYNPRTGWELILAPDLNFETKYSEVMQRQNLYWEAKQRQFNEMLLSETPVPKRQRKKSQRESFSSDTMLSPKPRCNSTSSNYNSEDIESDRKRVKNKSVSGTGKRTRNISTSSVQDM